MKYYSRFYAALVAAVWSGNSLASDSPAVTPSGGLLQIIMALLLVLALVVAAAWVMKRLGPIQGGNKIQVKIIGGINVGNRERVMVVEVADQWLILGVTANTINNLGSMPKQEELLLQAAQAQTNDPFSAWLKRTLDKRSTERPDNK